MKTIYENTVKGVGDLASAFAEEKTIILFGDSAPDTLKDYCYSIDVKKADEVIAPGQVLEIDGKQYKILLTGHVMQKNLPDIDWDAVEGMIDRSRA
jgi:PTS system glucitol/sorbitol-specific IIA component